MLLGTKADMAFSRVISQEEAQMLGEQHGIPYFETSAESNIGLEEVMG